MNQVYYLSYNYSNIPDHYSIQSILKDCRSSH